MIIDDLIKLLLEKEKTMTPEQKASKNKRDLELNSERGRSAMELENSKAFKDIMEPYIKTTLANNVRDLIYKGLELTNDEKNVRIAKMQSALNIYTVIERTKEEASRASDILSVERRAEKRKEERDQMAHKKQKQREKVIRREQKRKQKQEGGN